MEEKINIAELLKDCPKGMELDCTMFDNIKFISVEEGDKPICIKTGDIYRYLTKFGTWTCDENAKCVIFPKGKTTWEGFVPPCKFKNSDIVYIKSNKQNEYIIIFKEIKNDLVHKHAYFAYQLFSNDKCPLCHLVDIEIMRLATEEEKEKLFQAIKANGYKWNSETKTLEKLIKPKFKVGDKIVNDDYIVEIIDMDIEGEVYGYKSKVGVTGGILFSEQDKYELVPNKFDVNTLKTFDQVLVRLSNDCVWMPKFFYYYDTSPKVKYYPFVTIENLGYPQCIPYNGNEHLCRTTNNCDEFYRTWEK